ncbi:MAG: type II toxin-antitoxin system VapC family toxin [Candidatus Eremiobacteraeota bacterium]|nr:type II toxin-antitoxin system VapC family toxin [Candidatus Eremiobacteraeota bacterium]MBV9056108.1 type II toxin-antitoxin system VapC family toxin [Candidatus Eremiobacteraeota bacterium]MBV9699287.1 type II toxin-antitoxin system VapC family toxin [Candidatus Eremiobacteraeota bacterium]
MNPRRSAVIYWDTSAVLSVLFEDEHSAVALRRIRRTDVHLLSTLAWAETHAVLARLKRERRSSLFPAAQDVLTTGPWRRLNTVPDFDLVESLSLAWPLRGADLWHLAAAKTLQSELPELTLLSFDRRLADAAKGEGL